MFDHATAVAQVQKSWEQSVWLHRTSGKVVVRNYKGTEREKTRVLVSN